MENAFRCAAVAFWIMKNALRYAVRRQIRRSQGVLVRWERHHTSQARSVQHKSIARQARRRVRDDVTKVCVKERLDASIGRTKTISEQLIFLVIVAQEGAGDLESMPVCCAMAEGLP